MEYTQRGYLVTLVLIVPSISFFIYTIKVPRLDTISMPCVLVLHDCHCFPVAAGVNDVQLAPTTLRSLGLVL